MDRCSKQQCIIPKPVNTDNTNHWQKMWVQVYQQKAGMQHPHLKHTKRWTKTEHLFVSKATSANPSSTNILVVFAFLNTDTVNGNKHILQQKKKKDTSVPNYDNMPTAFNIESTRSLICRLQRNIWGGWSHSTRVRNTRNSVTCQPAFIGEIIAYRRCIPKRGCCCHAAQGGDLWNWTCIQISLLGVHQKQSTSTKCWR